MVASLLALTACAATQKSGADVLRPIPASISGDAGTTGHVLHVIDGDSLRRGTKRYRLHGIDAPEADQRCDGPTGSWPCGQEATAALARMVAGQPVRCDEHSFDRYGRIIATCYAGLVELNGAMVEQGHAWAFRRYATDYVAAENNARSARRGIWAGKAVPAWEYRQIARQSSAQSCAIKGNISRNGRIYHVPGSRWYGRTRINEAKGERWFCSEADALAAGWRAPR